MQMAAPLSQPRSTLALESAYAEISPLLRRRVRAMLRDPEAAEDVLQETFLRAWQKGPGAENRRALQAWLIRTASNLALDELRRRRRRPASSLEAAQQLAPAEAELPLANDVLAGLSAHERFVLLMRFEAGLNSGELGHVLGISELAARKRVERARARFRERLAAAQAADSRPLITVVSRDGTLDRYREWLNAAGARVRPVEKITLRELIYADGVVIGSATDDVHPTTYGETIQAPLRGAPDERTDRTELAAIQAALRENVPLVGICSGHQLLNVLSGGTLYQDLERQDPRAARHSDDEHQIETTSESTLRRVVGSASIVESVHHQAVRRLGARLRVAATSPDGVVEGIERTDRAFAVGVQWHPERAPGTAPSRLLAEAFVEHTARRAA